MESEYMKSIEIIRKQLEEISRPFKIMEENFRKQNAFAEISKTLSEQLKIPKVDFILPNFQSVIGKVNNFDIIKDYVEKMQNPLHEIQKILSNSKIKSRINGAQVERLNQFYWVIPFEIEYEKLEEILKTKDEIEFNNFVVEYFTNDRIKRIIEKISDKFETVDKKELMKQIEKAYSNELYALCITSLITLMDGLTLDLITTDSECQHLSYKAVNSMLEYINEAPISEFGYELYLKVCVLNNFYTKLYETERSLKDNNKEILSRHLNSHGVKYSNDKIDCLRILNAIYFCQEILQETDMQDKFFRKKNEKEFSVRGDN